MRSVASILAVGTTERAPPSRIESGKMATPGRTQKQIAERYKGNLGYYKKKHPWRVARSIAALVAIVGGIAGLILFQLRGQETFFTTGPISSTHATFGDDCAKCHEKAVPDSGLTFSDVKKVVRDRFRHGMDFTAIDRSCQQCHQSHDFHAPGVVENRSCSACHKEHEGPGAMKAVASSNCASCHNQPDVMQAAAQKAASLPPSAFHHQLSSVTPVAANRIVFKLPRPQAGYTQPFASFESGHPEFQLAREKARDPNVLRFNHQRHEAADIPLVNGKKLDCNYCHKPEADGRYYQRISFAANCQACHSLQFDAKNPELTLPHGDPTAVRVFLRTLPAQYSELALRKGITKQSEVQSFVARQMTQLRERVRSGENFEQQVFFTTNPYKAERETGSRGRGSFYGCAFCHDVKPVANGAPAVTKPILVDRWMSQAHFDHAKHVSVRCDECHHASQSRETSDLLMPVKANCVTCHSPKGRVVSDCTTCHRYHVPAQMAAAASPPLAGGDSFKQMMLGATR